MGCFLNEINSSVIITFNFRDKIKWSTSGGKHSTDM